MAEEITSWLCAQNEKLDIILAQGNKLTNTHGLLSKDRLAKYSRLL